MTLCFILFSLFVLVVVNFWVDDVENWLIGFSVLIGAVTLIAAGVMGNQNVNVLSLWQHFFVSLLAIWGINPLLNKMLAPIKSIVELLESKKILALAKMNAERAEYEKQIAKAQLEISSFSRTGNHS
jgi:hypothetical protein